MKKRGLSFLSAGIVSLFLFWSCEDYITQFTDLKDLSREVEISPAFAIPIGYGEFSLDNILEQVIDSNSIIQLTDDSLMYIYFSEEIDPVYVRDYLPTISDNNGTQAIVKSDLEIGGPFDLIPIGTPVEFSRNESVVFTVGDANRIDSVYLKAGNLEIEIFNEFKHSGELRISSNGLKDTNGDTLSLVYPFAETDGTYRKDETIDLSGYTITTNLEGGQTMIRINFGLTLIKAAGGLDPDEEAGLNVNFTGIEISAFFGKIEQLGIDTDSQELPFDLLGNLNIDIPSFYFADPSITLTIDNSVGLPIEIDLGISTRSAFDGTVYTLDFNDNEPITINAPSLDNVGGMETTVVEINANTSNIDSVLSVVPDNIEFSAGVWVGNPEGDESTNFFLDTSTIAIKADIELPFYFSIEEYTVDTTLNLTSNEQLSSITQIDSLILLMRTVNEWPFELKVQLYVLDENYNVTDSIFSDYTPILAAAPVDAEGNLDRSRLEENEVEIRLLGEDANIIAEAEYIKFKASIVTTDGGSVPVKFRSNYKLSYSLGIAAGVTLNTNELGISK